MGMSRKGMGSVQCLENSKAEKILGEKDKEKEFQMEETYNNHQTPRGTPGAGGSWESQHKEKPSQPAASMSPIPSLSSPLLRHRASGKPQSCRVSKTAPGTVVSHCYCLGIGLECLRGQQGAESTTLTQLLQPQLSPGATAWARGGDSCVPKSAQRAQGAGRDHGRLQAPGEIPGEGRAEQNKRDK